MVVLDILLILLLLSFCSFQESVTAINSVFSILNIFAAPEVCHTNFMSLMRAAMDHLWMPVANAEVYTIWIE